MIVSFALEFRDEQSARKAADALWNKHKVTGEVDLIRTDNGTWRLDVHSEKNIREKTIESLGGKRIKARSTVTRM